MLPLHIIRIVTSTLMHVDIRSQRRLRDIFIITHI